MSAFHPFLTRTSLCTHTTFAAANLSAPPNPHLGITWPSITGNPIPPTADPIDTTPNVNPLCSLKCCPTTVSAGCTPNEIDKPIKNPCIRNTSQNCPGWTNESINNATVIPNPEPRSNHCIALPFQLPFFIKEQPTSTREMEGGGVINENAPLHQTDHKAPPTALPWHSSTPSAGSLQKLCLRKGLKRGRSASSSLGRSRSCS